MTHRCIEKTEPVTAIVFCRIHGQVGMLEQLADLFPVARENGDPDTRRNANIVVGNDKRRIKRLNDLPGDDFRILLVIDSLQENDKLVAAQTRNGIGPTHHHRQQTARHFLQEKITDIVAKRIIHRLESIQIDEQHGGFAPVPPRLRQRLMHAIVQQQAIREIGQRIV